MFRFLKLKEESFGLDISDLSLKIAKLKKKGRHFSLASWGEFPLKPGIIEEGEIKDKKALVEAVKKSLKKVKGEKLKTDKAAVSLPEKKSFVQIISMPKMKRDELEKAVPFEAENYIPLPAEKAYIDFQVVEEKKKTDVLIAAISKDTVNSYFECLKKAGLEPRAFEIESQSIARAVVKRSSFPLFIVDFGRSNASFIIFSGSSVRFTSSSSLASMSLTKKLAKELKAGEKEAEKLKIKYGLSGRAKKGKKVSKILSSALGELVEEIKKYKEYYKSHSSEEVEKILLCGRGSNLKGLPEFLSSETGLPVAKANPWINILPHPLKEIPELSYEDSLGYTTALGLALRGIKDD